jgi:TolA-binding protein
MIRATFCLIFIAATLGAADKPSREILELQREVAQLDAKLTAMQQSLETRLTAMAAQMQAAAESAAKAAAAQSAAATAAQEQGAKSASALTQQGTRLDQFGSTISTMQQAIGDLTAVVNRIQTEITDVSNAVKVLQAPAAQPPKPAAADLLRSAEADKLGGKYELAAQEYSDFLKYYADAPEADGALFQLGMTHYAMKDFDAALRDYDALASRYADSKRLPEALFYKAKSLQALKRAAAARATCLDLRKRYPTSEFARQCPVARQ